MRKKNKEVVDYTNMLLNSAEIIHEILITKNFKDKEDIRLTIATANALTQTIKTYIQAEILEYKLNTLRGNTSQTISSLLEYNGQD